MEGSKPWYQSTTIQSALVGVLVAVVALLKAFGWQFNLEENQIVEILGVLLLIGTYIGSIWGRIKATYVIK